MCMYNFIILFWLCVSSADAPPAEFRVFQKYYGSLKSILSAQNLSQYFVSANLITFQDKEEICAAATSAKRAAILLQRIASPLQGGHSFYFHKMLEIMEGHGNIATRELAHKMQADLVVETSKPRLPLSSQMASIPMRETQLPPESAATLHQRSVMPHGNRDVMSPHVTAAVAQSSVDSADEGLETIDLKGTYEHVHISSPCVHGL